MDLAQFTLPEKMEVQTAFVSVGWGREMASIPELGCSEVSFHAQLLEEGRDVQMGSLFPVTPAERTLHLPT